MFDFSPLIKYLIPVCLPTPQTNTKRCGWLSAPALCLTGVESHQKFPTQQIPPQKLKGEFNFEPKAGGHFPPSVAVLCRAWGFPEYHDFIGAAPYCRYDQCWLPYSSVYSVAVYMPDEVVHKVVLRELTAIAAELKIQDLKSLSDSHKQTLIGRVVDVLLEPEIEKTFCFIFAGKSQMKILGGDFTSPLRNALSNVVANSFDYAGAQVALASLTKILKKADVGEGSVLLITTNANCPPLASFLFSPEPNCPLEFIGGVTGSTLCDLIHMSFLRDPTREKHQAQLPTVSAQLIAHMRERVSKLVEDLLNEV